MSLTAKTRHVHFVGIGGIGMSGIAELLLKIGHRVSGSDSAESASTQRLKSLGAVVQLGHSDKIIESQKPDVLVYSTAVRILENPETICARKMGIPLIRRAEMLAELMRLKRGIAIAGSHGKTTTTGLVSLILKESGLDPTIVIGGRFDAIGSNAAWGGGEWLVAEADESDGSFLRLNPELAVVTNIDREHLDHYETFEAGQRAFGEFLDHLPFYGRGILCADCSVLRKVASDIQRSFIWYGFEKERAPDFLLKIVQEGAESDFEIYRKVDSYSRKLCSIHLKVPGRHNMLNATAALLCALEIGVELSVGLAALTKFQGVERRFERKGSFRGHPIFEDYAHHPTEIVATLQAATAAFPNVKPIVIFQPHRFSRTRDQWQEFATCFKGAGEVWALPIYAASEIREKWVEELDGAKFAGNVSTGAAISFANHKELVAHALKNVESLKSGAPMLVLGAGDVAKVIPLLLASP